VSHSRGAAQQRHRNRIASHLAFVPLSLRKKDTSDLCFGSHDRRRRSATVFAANGLSIW
jgi:hypothetical protein